MQAFSFAPPSLPGSTGGPPFQFVVTSAGDHRELADVLDKINQEAQKSGLFIFTDGDLRFDTPQIELKIDRDKANQLGVTMQDVGATIATLLGGNYVNRFNMQGRSYQVIPQVPRYFRLTPGVAAALPDQDDVGRHGAAVVVRDGGTIGAADGAQHLPAAQLGHDLRRAVPRPQHGRGGGVHGGEGGGADAARA